jgi:hypothetical protein
MALRTLRRKVIIREYDYFKVEQQAIGNLGFYNIASLYDRAEFIPINQEALEKLKMIEILKGKEHTPLISAEWNNNIPAMMLYHLKDYLYNDKYCQWDVTLDKDGYICVQARKNTPKTRLGWAVFEKDMTCRI